MPKKEYEENEDIDNLEDLEEEDEDNELDRGDDFDSDEDDEDGEDEDSDQSDDEEDVGDDSESDEPDDDEDGDSDEEDQDEDEEEKRIPKSRLDQVLGQRDAERERSQWLENQLEKLIDQGAPAQTKAEPEVEPFDYDAAETKYAELLLEGESEKAAKVRNLINRSRQEDMETMINKITTDVTEQSSTKTTEQIENNKFNDLVESYEGLYPSLNADHKDYSEEHTEMVNILLAGYVAQGKTKTEGLRLAVKKVIPKQAPKKKASLGNSRDKQSRQKKADTSNRQPPRTKSSKMASGDTGDVVVSKLSERDYNKLSLRERKILRGD